MNLNTIKSGFLFLLFSLSLSAQQQVIPIWTALAPGSETWTQKEVQYLNDQKQLMIRNVVLPTISVYRPDPVKANGTAVIVAPGGGFMFLSWQTEGTEVAEWLATRGVTAFVLKYRTMNTGTQEEFLKIQSDARERANTSNPTNTGTPGDNINQNKTDASILAQEDGRQAIRIVRSRASEWGLNPDRIGIIGFSAGGMITLGTILKSDKKTSPDFAGAIYTPWSDGMVPKDAPPLFILVAGDDRLAAAGSVQMYSAWKAAGKEAELHVYSKGGHGFGMQKQGLPVDNWIERYGDWLALQGLLIKQ
jgi:acetyl esterase/lipase